MKATVVPAKSSSWQIQDVPQPQPSPGQVLVKMRASGISEVIPKNRAPEALILSPRLQMFLPLNENPGDPS
jgi:hypothetical protein